MNLAHRLGQLGESATLAVSRKAKELAARGVEVVDLSAGEPDFDSPAVAVEAVRRALAEGKTRYTAAAGLPELRAELARRYGAERGAPWTADQVVVTVGAKAALMELALALVGDGDEVVVPTPYWVSIPAQIRLAGGRPVDVPCSARDAFRLRAEPVLAALTPRTRGVILNSPCNPTGGVLGADDLETVVAACAERGVWVVSDETYERFVFDGEGHASVAAVAARYPDTVILVGSFSKTYAMTGWRLGYLLGPPPVVKAVTAIQSHATSNPTTFAMYGALAAMRDAEGGVVAMIREFEHRRDLVAAALDAMPGVQCRPPAGAFYAFPRVADLYADGCRGSVEMASLLLEKARVAVVPGIAFGNDDHLRISFACSRERLDEGLSRIGEAFAAMG
ncbi:MAG: pyridoxal phosphate-dependent aminotransferase [Thermoanaerobaculia bacterium]|nr:pyridoxal phosphate-dependent aminotransferase [Thermoanaerobaculia bacterium]